MVSVTTDYDSIIIGAGVAGCCLARELSRYRLSCAVLEAGNDVAFATSRANSGIVHAGFDPPPGTLKARYCAQGSRMFSDWQAELEFAYQQNGSLVLAFSDSELETLQDLKGRAQANGVLVELLDARSLRELESAVSPDAIGALRAPHAGICDPYGLTFAAAENAAENGVAFHFGEQVVDLEKAQEGFRIQSASGKAFTCRVLVNAAGVFSDELNNMLSAHSLSILPVSGEYMLYDTPYGTTFTHTMFQAPGVMGKGVLVAPTTQGGLLIGPDAVPQNSKTSVDTSATGLENILAHARKTWPAAGRDGIITNFAGLRAKGENRDFVIGEAPDVPGFYNIACFESPGLTSAPAVAADVSEQIARALSAGLRKDFNPRRIRSGRKLFAFMSDEERALAIAEDPDHGQIVCRCCNVSRSDIVYEFKGPLPVLCLDALKWRTNVMMGRCHGGFCAPELMQIVHEHTGLLPEQIDKRLVGSPFVASSSSVYAKCRGAVPKKGPNDTGEYAPGLNAGIPDERTREGGVPSKCAHRGRLAAERLPAEGAQVDSMPPEYVPAENAPARSDQEGSIPTEPKLNGHASNGHASNEGPSNGQLTTGRPSTRDLSYDVAIVGAGAAGMAAALAAVEEGAKHVALLDREGFFGGILRQCIHNGFGLTRFGNELTGPEYAGLEARKLRDSGVDLFLGTTVLSLDAGESPAPHLILASSRRGLLRFSAKAVVLANGSRERGQGAMNMAGSRPSGVFSAGSAQALINLKGCLPGHRVIIQGSGDIGLIMARRCLFSGAEVLGVFARSSKPSGLRRNVQQCLDDYGIPFFGNRLATRLEGAGRLDAVWISSVDPITKQVVPDSEERWPCDTLLLSIGLLPESELALAAGIALDGRTGGPLVNSWLETSAPGVFACGNALHIHDLADGASEEGEQAGRRAAQFAQGLSCTEAVAAAVSSGKPLSVEPSPAPPDEGIADPSLEFVCVRCPKGCVLSVLLTEDGSIERVSGEGCKRGLAYAEDEVRNPRRIVTDSIPVGRSLEPLSVRTAEPVPREKIFAVLAEAKALDLMAPVEEGTVLIPDVAQSGVALIATKTIKGATCPTHKASSLP